MTRLDALLLWLAAAGEAGATSAAVAAWARRHNWPDSTTSMLLARAVQRGQLAATTQGYAHTGQVCRVYRIRQRGAA